MNKYYYHSPAVRYKFRNFLDVPLEVDKKTFGANIYSIKYNQGNLIDVKNLLERTVKSRFTKKRFYKDDYKMIPKGKSESIKNPSDIISIWKPFKSYTPTFSIKKSTPRKNHERVYSVQGKRIETGLKLQRISKKLDASTFTISHVSIINN
jgi:hypothetical protein